MNIHPIKTELDYENSLQEIEKLWGSPEETPAGEKLDILLILVEAYENEHYKIDPPVQLKLSNSEWNNLD